MPWTPKYTTTCCEHCGTGFADGDLKLNPRHDEYWCDDCFDNEAETAGDRQQERLMEDPPESAREEQLRTWAEHQRLHRR